MFAPARSTVKWATGERVIVPIDDPADPRLDEYRQLADPAARHRREGSELFVVEGTTAIERLLESDHPVRSVLVTPARLDRLAHRLGTLDAPVYVAEREVLATTVGFDLHRGAVASATRRPLPSLATVLASSRRIAVLEGLNDAENLGAIARSARAFGIDALVIDATCTDPYYRRTVRVSMGEVLFLPVARAEDWPAALASIEAAGFETWALTPAGDADDIWSLRRPELLALVLGAEGSGLRPATLSAATRRVRIPIAPAVDSLNVAAAAAVAFAATSR
jgi:tRNA G18 (ribose-2'-O)-methylase SpoU